MPMTKDQLAAEVTRLNHENVRLEQAIGRMKSDANRRATEMNAARDRIDNLKTLAARMEGFIRAHHTTTKQTVPAFAGDPGVQEDVWPFKGELK